MAKTNTTERQALWLPGGTEDSRFPDGDRHLRLVYDDKEEGTDHRQSVVLPH